MAGSLHSTSWYRVAGLRPQLREHARLYRHHYRGQRWYVLQDPASGRCHRLSPTAHHLIGLMDGRRTAQEIWDTCLEVLGDDAPTQDETIRLLGLLYQADVLRCDVTPDLGEMLERSVRREASEGWKQVLSPFYLRLPLLDPDSLLERASFLVRPIFTQLGFVLWCAGIALGLLLASQHWSELVHDSSSGLLQGRNLWLALAIYPLVKGLHELGHGLAAKAWGAEVHEMGIALVVFLPVPYVDTSSIAVLPEKSRRMIVSAAGIMVELSLAIVALLVWLAVEPGLVRAGALHVMWICSASTLLFNGNPLIRFDAYYVLADALEIPNLYGRSTQFLSYLVQHYCLGLDAVRNPTIVDDEAPWLAAYGVAASCYRIAITLTIAWYVAEHFFVLGVLLALSSLVLQIGIPLARGVAYLVASPRLGAKRARALVTAGGIALGLAGLSLLVPLPLHTRAEGVVWTPEKSQVRAGTDAFVKQVLVRPGSAVGRGDPLILTEDPTLESRVRALRAKRAALLSRYHAERHDNLVRSQLTLEELKVAEAALTRASEQVREEVVRSPVDGIFILPGADDLVDHFVRQGDLLGYVVGHGNATVRVVIPQADVDLVWEQTERVQVRLASRVSDVEEATIERHVPAASDLLPSAALGHAGGGIWPVDPSDESGMRTSIPCFQLDLRLTHGKGLDEIGERVYVRFTHGMEPIAGRVYRAVRRLFLSRLGV
ncbi:MAG: peptidase M50 [Deltaproteobacteria bacterium]|nr:peptidase M50 [Deltaproteobacteria bacterium]